MGTKAGEGADEQALDEVSTHEGKDQSAKGKAVKTAIYCKHHCHHLQRDYGSAELLFFTGEVFWGIHLVAEKEKKEMKVIIFKKPKTQTKAIRRKYCGLEVNE